MEVRHDAAMDNLSTEDRHQPSPAPSKQVKASSVHVDTITPIPSLRGCKRSSCLSWSDAKAKAMEKGIRLCKSAITGLGTSKLSLDGSSLVVEDKVVIHGISVYCLLVAQNFGYLVEKSKTVVTGRVTRKLVKNYGQRKIN